MKYFQEQDKDLQMVKRELTSGQRPQLKNTKVNSIKRYLQNQSKITISKDGLLVSQKMGRRFSSKDLIVIPESVSRGILYGLHLNLKHPTSFQLKKVVDTKFFILDKDKIIDDITNKCDLCQSLAQIPKEIETFKANQVPDHPGMEFTVDILKYSKKLAVVATDNFSGFISTTLIQSEANEHLLEGIIITVLFRYLIIHVFKFIIWHDFHIFLKIIIIREDHFESFRVLLSTPFFICIEIII